MNHNDYNKLKQLAKYISRLIESGKWTTLAKERQLALQNALKQLTFRLRNFVARRKMLRLLGAAVMLISANVNAQSFDPPVTNAFEMDGYSYLNKPEFVDIDGDGDLDFFQVNSDDETIDFQENTGTATEPEFADIVTNPFDLSADNLPIMPIFGDLDNDGDFDMLASTYEEGTPMYFENVGTAEEPSFASPTLSPFGITTIYTIMGDLVDIDGDGDLDLFTSRYDDDGSEVGKVYFHENTGSEDAPAFATGEEDFFGTTFEAEYAFPFVDFADFDDDGDFDFMRVDMYGTVVYYHENIGDADTPEYEAGPGEESPFDIDPLGGDGGFFGLSLTDIDDDGDFDLFISEYESSSYLFYENKTYTVGINDATGNDILVSIYPNPTSNQLNLQTSLPASEVEQVRILTLDGKDVYQSNTFTKSIDVSQLPGGIYMVALRLNSGKETHLKFVKE